MTENILQGRGFSGRSLIIASVFPQERKAQRDYGADMDGGRTIFKLPAAPKGEVKTLRISDCWELIETDKGVIGTPVFEPRLVPVEAIAACLLKEWAINIAGTRTGRRPGIMTIAGEEPTKAEIDTLNSMQASYFDGLIQDANASAARHAWREINDLHRDAAKWRGYEAPWVTDLGEGKEKKPCFYCAEKIQSMAKFCLHCKQFQPGFEPQQQNAEAAAPAKPGRPTLPPPMKTPSAQVAA